MSKTFGEQVVQRLFIQRHQNEFMRQLARTAIRDLRLYRRMKRR